MVIENAGADILVLAGDICTANNFKQFASFFEQCSKEFDQVVYVMGNHEHYRHNFQMTSLIIKKNLSHLKNVNLYDNASRIFSDKIIFYGATLWTDCNESNKETRNVLASSMNDFRLIKYDQWDHMLPINSETEFYQTIENLKRFLLKLTDYKVVVVTHHAPSFQSIHSRYQNDFHMNGGFASDLERIIKKHPEIKLWVHGHMHNSFDYKIGETRVICNPAGYPTWQGTENGNFNPNLVIEL